MNALAPRPPPEEPCPRDEFEATRQALLGSWRRLIPHLTAEEAQHEARSTHQAMINLTLLGARSDGPV